MAEQTRNLDMKPTVGKWHNNGGRIESERNGHGLRVIATVGTVNEQTPEDTANARIIEAGPLMLHTLQMLRTMMHRQEESARSFTELIDAALEDAELEAEGS